MQNKNDFAPNLKRNTRQHRTFFTGAAVWIVFLITAGLFSGIFSGGNIQPVMASNLPEGTVTIEPTSTPTPYPIYLPQVVDDVNAYNDLLGPTSGATISSLAPTFSWNIQTNTDTRDACLALSTSSVPDSCTLQFTILSSHTDFHLGYNLSPNTQYFWRIGLVRNLDYDNPEWTEVSSFWTGNQTTSQLSAPELLSIADGKTVSSDLVELNWEPVDGAEGYFIIVRAEDTGHLIGFSTDGDTTANLEIGMLNGIGYGTHYSWSVAAFNSYGYGVRSDEWRVGYTGSSFPPGNIPDIFHLVIPDMGDMPVEMFQ